MMCGVPHITFRNIKNEKDLMKRKMKDLKRQTIEKRKSSNNLAVERLKSWIMHVLTDIWITFKRDFKSLVND